MFQRTSAQGFLIPPFVCPIKINICSKKQIFILIHIFLCSKDYSCMAYLKRWRNRRAEVLALAEASNSSDNDEASILVDARFALHVHERGDSDLSCGW